MPQLHPPPPARGQTLLLRLFKNENCVCLAENCQLCRKRGLLIATLKATQFCKNFVHSPSFYERNSLSCFAKTRKRIVCPSWAHSSASCTVQSAVCPSPDKTLQGDPESDTTNGSCQFEVSCPQQTPWSQAFLIQGFGQGNPTSKNEKLSQVPISQTFLISLNPGFW